MRFPLSVFIIRHNLLLIFVPKAQLVTTFKCRPVDAAFSLLHRQSLPRNSDPVSDLKVLKRSFPRFFPLASGSRPDLLCSPVESPIANLINETVCRSPHDLVHKLFPAFLLSLACGAVVVFSPLVMVKEEMVSLPRPFFQWTPFTVQPASRVFFASEVSAP